MALTFVTSNMTRLMNENSSALFLFSILTSYFSCAKPRKLDDLLLFQQGRISEWLVLFRGTGAIIEYAQEELRSGPLAALLSIRQRRSDYRNSLPTQGQAFMDDLEELIREEVKEQQELQVYLGAIQEMRVSYALWSDIGMWETGDVLVWLLRVSEEFLTLLREQRYVALVIFGYLSFAAPVGVDVVVGGVECAFTFSNPWVAGSGASHLDPVADGAAGVAAVRNRYGCHAVYPAWSPSHNSPTFPTY